MGSAITRLHLTAKQFVDLLVVAKTIDVMRKKPNINHINLHGYRIHEDFFIY